MEGQAWNETDRIPSGAEIATEAGTGRNPYRGTISKRRRSGAASQGAIGTPTETGTAPASGKAMRDGVDRRSRSERRGRIQTDESIRHGSLRRSGGGRKRPGAEKRNKKNECRLVGPHPSLFTGAASF